uniref:Uncharacterized protein n=1 Tax=Anguilla anguilla TaxID=7936 RepID=A0A0E9Q0V3_ANGAN
MSLRVFTGHRPLISTKKKTFTTRKIYNLQPSFQN